MAFLGASWEPLDSKGVFINGVVAFSEDLFELMNAFVCAGLGG